MELKPNLALQSSLGPGAELFWVLNQRLAIWQSNPISCDPKWFILGLGFEPQRGGTGVGVHFGACLGHVGGYVRALLGQIGPDWGGGKQPQPKLVGLGLDWAPFWVYVAATLRRFVGPIWGPNCIIRERMLLQHCSCVTVSGSLRLAFLARRAKAKLHPI